MLSGSYCNSFYSLASVSVSCRAWFDIFVINRYQSHRFMDSQLTNILQLSVALLVDLGLNKAPCTSDKHQIVTDTTKMFHGNSAYSQVRTNDERRAFLGCFYLTSMLVTVSNVQRAAFPLFC